MDVRSPLDEELKLVEDDSEVGETEAAFYMEEWQKDGFDSYEEYEEWYVKYVDDLLEESRDAWGDVKKGWRWANKRYESAEADTANTFNTPTRTRLPMLHHAIEESVATLVENWPRPSCVSRQAVQDDFASGLTYYIAEALDENNFDVLLARAVLDGRRMFVGCIKATIDDTQTGPLGNPGKIVLRNIDPRYLWFDPYAKGYEWDQMRYLAVTEPYDLTEIQSLFPARGKYVRAEGMYSTSRENDDEKDIAPKGDGQWWSPLSQGDGGFVIGQRRRALVKELWVHDDRKERGPDGNLRMRYPNGRCIITANGVLLADLPNPYRHKEPPYVFFPSRLAPKVLAYADLELLARLEDKVNLLHLDMLKNARANMNSPWATDTKTFPSREMYKRLSNNPGEVIITNPGTRLERLPPGDIPAFIFPLLDWLSGVFDDILGITDIMRGSISKGSQLSAEAIQGLQGNATARIRLKARLMEASLKKLGYQLQWLIRQAYPSDMTVQIIDPKDQKQKAIHWSNDENQPDYPVAIETGASVPGAKQGSMQQALVMYQNNLIDRKAALAAFGIPGAAAIDERMTKKEMLELEIGMTKQSRNPNPSGKPGRKNNLPQKGSM